MANASYVQPDQDNSLVYGLVVNCQYNPNISCVPITKFHKAVNALQEHLRFVHCEQPRLKATMKAAGILQNAEFHCEHYVS
jgi:hypothetical protein